MNAEQGRLEEDRLQREAWRKWGPYLSERQWGTVREDYSADGDAWRSFPHDHARSRAYRWGEDGLAGISDDEQRLCFALALWNGRDPILKERLFGLTNPEGNHGEDVKECYYYVDATPTHSYLKMLYKYPQQAFPYARLVEENRRRGKLDPEFELIDTGIFDDNRYFDVFVEYAKASPDDVLIHVAVLNRGKDEAPIHLLPQLWFRNTWTWVGNATKPNIAIAASGALEAFHPELGKYYLYCEGDSRLLFCENETNLRRLYRLDVQGYFKDAFHEYVVQGNLAAVNPRQTGTKAGALYSRVVPAHGLASIRLRLSNRPLNEPFVDHADILHQRLEEADEFYADLHGDLDDPEARAVQRQALAGMIWNKQFYHFDVPQWLRGDSALPPPPPARRHGRNAGWTHLNTADVLSMPDKWEYPYFCAWDSAFHCVALATVDPEFAKQQLLLFTREWYMHPNGQLPAYEWNFDDVNPPVHAWAAWRVFQMDRKRRGDCGDHGFLERIFHKLLLNFTWWVNRKDAQGLNVFQGGFLGMDNIGVFDRSAALPGGGRLHQADGTAWMAAYCLHLMRIALELALHNHVYEDVATKFFEHFLHIAEAMTQVGGQDVGVGLWDEEDKFYYDELRLPNGQIHKLRVRSMVGLVPLFAVEILEPELLQQLPEFDRRLAWFLSYRPDLASLVSHWDEPGRGQRRLLSLLRGHRMKRLLRRMLDETEFLSEFGVRSLSRAHRDQPYVFDCCGHWLTVAYRPAESDSDLFGGNSNWRGPIWFPVNYLIVEALLKFHAYYGDEFKVECPTGSGTYLSLREVADELARRLTRLFLRDERGRRPAFGDVDKFQTDPHFRDYLLFHEYFDGDTGRGAGAAHQTGWTALIALLLNGARTDSLVQECAEERMHEFAHGI
jgi:hypothetical protein